MSAAGQTYNGADGTPIKNHGRTTVHFEDPAGNKRGMQFQVADVTQPLISVAQMVDAGHVVMFTETGGWIHHLSTGKRIRLPRVGNTFVLDMHETAASEEEEGGAEASAFRRPE